MGRFNKYTFLSDLYGLVKIAILIFAIVAFVYFVKKNDIIERLKAKSTAKTLEEITSVSFDKITNVNTDTGMNESVEQFVNDYKDKKYETYNDASKYEQKANVIYYLYDNSNILYTLYDLGDGYIKIVQAKKIPKIYKLEVE